MGKRQRIREKPGLRDGAREAQRSAPRGLRVSKGWGEGRKGQACDPRARQKAYGPLQAKMDGTACQGLCGGEERELT